MAIVGEASTSESVEKFVNNLREKNDILMLSKLAVNSKFDRIPARIPNGFTFEITTQGKEIDVTEDTNMLPYTNAIHPVETQNIYMPQGGMLPPPSPVI